MTDNLSLLQFSLQERALHQLAKVCWGDYFMSSGSIEFYEIVEFLYEETSKLINHRKCVVSEIPRILPTLPKIMKDRLIVAIVLIQRGYKEALVCTNIYKNHIKQLSLFPLSPGPYAAKNFIDPSGRFDEINWAKRFVSDESQSLYRRFDVACFYCFEGEIKELWGTMEGIGRSHYERSFTYIEKKYGYMAAIWALRLKNKIDSPIDFYKEGFIVAIDSGYEYAARFFWNACSAKEKEELVFEMEEFNMICNAVSSDAFQFRHEGFAQYYYSHLSLEQKQNIVLLTAPIGAHVLWSCLVTSRSYEIVLKDFQSIPFPTSSVTYAYVLNELTVKMLELPIPVYEEIFKVLWEPFSQTEVKNILGLGLNIISNLTEVNSLDLLKLVIEPLDRIEKDWMLINDWQLAGISAVWKFLVIGDYDGLRHYLLLFLVDRDRVTQKLSVRTDAFYLFNSFIQEWNNLLMSNGDQIPEYVTIETNKVIESIQGSLVVLHCLSEQVDQVNQLV